MAWVHQIKAAVGKADPQTLPPPDLDAVQQRLWLHDLRLGAREVAVPQLLGQLARVGDGGADLADDAGRDEPAPPACKSEAPVARPPACRHRVAGARDIEHFTSLGGESVRRSVSSTSIMPS